MKIAITYTGSEEKHNNYVRWLKAGDSIEVVKISAQDQNLHELNSCDGLLLTGGRDIHPKFYNSISTVYPNAPQDFDVQRDEFEIAAFKKARENKLPVLGICRGMQLVNCILGGTLKPDLGESLNIIHRSENLVDKAHGINISEGTMIQSITGRERGVANSSHHQSIDQVGNGLKINCTADDGTIEGIEWADPSGKSFLLCVQWHPERMYRLQLENAILAKNIRDKFIEEIKKSIRAHEDH